MVKRCQKLVQIVFFSSKTCVFMTVDFGFELLITLVHSKNSSYDLMLDVEDGS